MLVFRRIHRNEQGIALITVVGMAGVLFLLATTLAMQSVNNLRQVGVESRQVTAVQVSDAGIDNALFELNKVDTWNTGETVPSSFASTTAERDWAIAAANAAAGTRLRTSPEGQYVIVKPSNQSVIYSVGYVPSYAAAANVRRVRVIRASYGLTSLPTNNYAFLSNSNLEFGPDHLDVKFGSIHANGTVNITGHGKIDGAVTSTGTYTKTGSLKLGDSGNSGGGRPSIDVPIVTPQSYHAYAQYDLCPDGSVHTAATTICGGTTLVSDATNGYRGWKPVTVSGTYGKVWKYDTKTAYDGIYYIKDGSAWITGKIKKWNVSVFAASSGTTCNQVGGDIIVRDGTSDKWNPATGGQGVLFMAGRDFDFGNPYSSADKKDFTNGRAHLHKSTGLIYAGENFRAGKDHLQIDGAIIAAGAQGCDSPGSPVSSNVSGHVHIKYVPTQLIPADRVRVTAWQEL